MRNRTEIIRGDIGVNDYSVKIYYGNIGCESTIVFLEKVTKAVAKSVCRHFNKQICLQEKLCGCTINMLYYADCPDMHEPDLDYWR